MLMCLSSLGALLAEALQCTYMRICCQLQQQHQHQQQRGEQEKRTMTKRRHAAGNGVSQTVRMIDITYAAAAATAVANLSSLSYRNFIVLTFLWILIRLLWQWAYYGGGEAWQ